MRYARPLPLSLAVLIWAIAPARAQLPAALRGRVVVDRIEEPLFGAEIHVTNVSAGAISDSAGRFLIVNVPAGKQAVSVRRLGYALINAVLTFSEGDTIEADFLLSPVAARLGRIEIKGKETDPRIVGFNERRQAGFGNFMGPEQLEKMHNRRTDDVLRLIPGPMLHRSFNSPGAWVAGGRMATATGGYTVERSDRNKGAPTTACYATVYLDGVAMFSALRGEILFDVNSVPASDLAGIEYYSGSSTVPPRYPQKANTCGVLVLWTK